MTNRSLSAFILTAALAAAASAQVGTKDLNLGGTVSFDAWKPFNNVNYPGYGGGFPGAAPWPNAIGSDVTHPTLGVSGDATFAKTSGAAYMASGSLYNGGFSGESNAVAASFSIRDATALANVKTVVLQLETGSSFGNVTFYNPSQGTNPASPVDGPKPLLTINGGTTVVPTFTTRLSSSSGTPIMNNPVTISNYAYQYDLSSITTPITSYAITWTNVVHAQIYNARLDSSTVAYTQAVPEPASMVALTLGGLALIRRKRRN